MNVTTITKLASIATDFASKNSPSILAGLAICGTVTTAVMAGKGVLKAERVLREHEMDDDLTEKDIFEDESGSHEVVYYRQPTKKEKLKLTWKCYIPAVLMGGATIACIISGNTISMRRNAALAAAYSLSEEAAREFKEKVVETLGEKKVKKIDQAIAEDKVKDIDERIDKYYDLIPNTGHGNDIIKDLCTGQIFISSIQNVDSAINLVNQKLLEEDVASVSDFYNYMGLDRDDQQFKFGDFLGWTTWNGANLVDFPKRGSILSPAGRPIVTIDYKAYSIFDPRPSASI